MKETRENMKEIRQETKEKIKETREKMKVTKEEMTETREMIKETREREEMNERYQSKREMASWQTLSGFLPSAGGAGGDVTECRRANRVI